jgi:hypothetical protein
MRRVHGGSMEVVSPCNGGCKATNSPYIGHMYIYIYILGTLTTPIIYTEMTELLRVMI